MPLDWLNALIGGCLIGLAVSLMLYWNGRVTGISGIVNGLLERPNQQQLWRWFFLGGLLLGGLILKVLNPEVFSSTLPTPGWTVVVAGLLVGFGTVWGSGCTSGHGVCGISRLSLRSILATIVFIGAGVATVAIFKRLGVMG